MVQAGSVARSSPGTLFTLLLLVVNCTTPPVVAAIAVYPTPASTVGEAAAGLPGSVAATFGPASDAATANESEIEEEENGLEPEEHTVLSVHSTDARIEEQVAAAWSSRRLETCYTLNMVDTYGDGWNDAVWMWVPSFTFFYFYFYDIGIFK